MWTGDLLKHKADLKAKEIRLTHAGEEVLQKQHLLPFAQAFDGEILLNNNKTYVPHF